MTKLGDLTLEGQSGAKYKFEVWPANSYWADDIACVYYVSKRTQQSDGGGDHSAIYVGETEDLKARFENHHKQSCFNNHDYNAISVHRVSGGADARRDIESDLIATVRPPCND